MFKDLIEDLAKKKNLTELQMIQALEDIFNGRVGTDEIVEFLTLLSKKTETTEELTAAVKVMLKYVEPINVDKPNIILDTCGTGADQKGTFNISTLTALVASGAGITVAKHGNRSVSSHCGSADILEAEGVNINMDKEKIKKCLEEIGIAFLFAPNLHPIMKYVMPARKRISQKTMFNLLGPLINPLRPKYQLIGVYSPNWTTTLARVLNNLGSIHVLVVHGKDGLDEVTLTDKTIVSELNRGMIKDYEVSPEDFGFRRVDLKDLKVFEPSDNLRIFEEVLNGENSPARDAVLLNAGFAIYTADKTSSIKEGIELARWSIDSGKAKEKLELLKEYSKR